MCVYMCQLLCWRWFGSVRFLFPCMSQFAIICPAMRFARLQVPVPLFKKGEQTGQLLISIALQAHSLDGNLHGPGTMELPW